MQGTKTGVRWNIYGTSLTICMISLLNSYQICGNKIRVTLPGEVGGGTEEQWKCISAVLKLHGSNPFWLFSVLNIHWAPTEFQGHRILSVSWSLDGIKATPIRMFQRAQLRAQLLWENFLMSSAHMRWLSHTYSASVFTSGIAADTLKYHFLCLVFCLT